MKLSELIKELQKFECRLGGNADVKIESTAGEYSAQDIEGIFEGKHTNYDEGRQAKPVLILHSGLTELSEGWLISYR